MDSLVFDLQAITQEEGIQSMDFAFIIMWQSGPDISSNVLSILKLDHNVKKVAIVDWDVHHGDGTQHVFQKDKNIMLISIHRYDRSTFYPGTEFGDVKNQGLG